MTPICTKIILLLSLLAMASANSEETLSKNVAYKIQDSEPTILEDAAAGSRFPELDPELVAKLNEYTENENAAFLEKRKKAREARAAAANTQKDKVEVATKKEDRFPELPAELDAKLYEQILNENEAFRENRKKIRAAKAADASSTQKEQEVRTSRGLRACIL
ncbi:MAG: hypothetical protein SGBAC_012030 [Bacillariaceae sp.]